MFSISHSEKLLLWILIVLSVISIENIFSSLSFNFVYNFFAINFIYIKKNTCLITRIFGLFGGFFSIPNLLSKILF